jgi:SAM-dependent methyltransferase
MKFDPRDPYPLIDLAQVPYEQQKIHAAEVDHWLGFEIERVESAIERDSQASRELAREQWIGLAPQSLQTPYVELRRIVEEARSARCENPARIADARIGEEVSDSAPTGRIPLIIDIGAAYGRMAFVLAAHWPEARFLGLELSAPRVEEGARVIAKHALPRAELVMSDAVTRELPVADVYFMYDFGSLRSIQTLLEKLQERARSASITVNGRGRATRDEIERRHPWLSQVVSPRHCGNFTIYQS